jgi:hypothetical protein
VTRWNRRLLFGAIALLVPALAGCEAGLNAPTLEFHPAANGNSVIEDGINIDNAFVLGPALNSTLPAGGQAGVFVALLSQNGDTLESVSAPGTASSATITGGPVSTICGAGPSRSLSGGETIKLVLTFATQGAVTLDVPVEPQAYSDATYSPPPTPTPTPTASASGTATASPSASS